METKFYLQDIHDQRLDGTPVVTKNVLFFSLERASHSGPNSVPTTFDNKATRDHVAQYRDAFKKFKKEHPEYVCPWPELDVKAEPAVEAPKKAKKEE